MADVAAGRVGKHAITLTANTVTAVTFEDDLLSVEVSTDGSARVFYTLDGTDPTVGGTHCYCVPTGFGSDEHEPRTPGGTVVKMISAGTPVVCVHRGD